jgi:hypothetical protein
MFINLGDRRRAPLSHFRESGSAAAPDTIGIATLGTL